MTISNLVNVNIDIPQLKDRVLKILNTLSTDDLRTDTGKVSIVDTAAKFCEQSQPGRRILIVEKVDSALLEIFKTGIHPVILKANSPILDVELGYTLRQMLSTSRTWAATPYFNNVQKYVLNSYSERFDVLKGLESSTNLSNQPWVIHGAQLFISEMVMNAYYDSQKTADGMQLHYETLRTTEVAHTGHAPELTIGVDEKYLIVQITDFHGSLSYEDIRKSLTRNLMAGGTLRKEGAGAGIGLYLSLLNTSALFIDVSKGSKTEMTGIFYRSKKRKDSQNGVGSLIFQIAEGDYENS